MNWILKSKTRSIVLCLLLMMLTPLVGVCVRQSVAQDSKSDKQASKKNRIRVPESKIVVTPLPGAVITLKAGEWCILEHDSDFFVRPHPMGIVEVDKKVYPKGLTVMGMFAGGGGKIETRDFNGIVIPPENLIPRYSSFSCDTLTHASIHTIVKHTAPIPTPVDKAVGICPRKV